MLSKTAKGTQIKERELRRHDLKISQGPKVSKINMNQYDTDTI